MKKSSIFMGMLVVILVFGTMIIGCASSPMDPNSVKLELGGTLPSDIMTYFTESQLADMNAKFIVVQGRVQVYDMGFYGIGAGYRGVTAGVLITVGGGYRISQMSYYRKAYTTSDNRVIPAEHITLKEVYIVPNMGTMYNSLQEARLASELAAP